MCWDMTQDMHREGGTRGAMTGKKKKKHDGVKNADVDLDKALKDEVSIIYSSAAIALSRYWGWGKKRITDLADLTQVVWHECAQTNLKSMPQMLEEETGIEVQNGDGQSWHDLGFLNVNVNIRWHRQTARAQWIYMRKKQLKWISPNVTACLLLSLYRKCGFGAERCQRLVTQMIGVQNEYGRDANALKAACELEAGVGIIQYMDSKEVTVDA